MTDVPVNGLADIGVVRDQPAHMLPPEAWTIGENIRIMDDGVARMPGWQRIFSSLTTTGPIYIVQAHESDGSIFWMYGTATGLFGIDDVPTLYDLSGAAYTAASWQSTFLGGIPILNNGSDDPQTWDFNTANNFQDLANWPASTSAKVIRAFGPFLVALHPTISGTRYPHLVMWSHPADPGTVPSSWDHTDPTVDAGRNDLSDVESGEIRAGLPLRGTFVIYKEHSTWLMKIIGGQSIMQFDQFLARSGVLAPECVQLTGDGAWHFVVTEDDIIIHDTVRVQSLLDRRMRKYLFNQIDGDNVDKSYVFANPRQKEMWFCYPSNGSSVVNRALIWSYGAGGPLGVFYEADYPYPWTALGDVDVSSEVAWDSAVGSWDSYYGAWNSSDRRRPVAVDTSGGKFMLLDSSLTRDGATFTSTLRRDGLAIVGRRRDGEPIVDFKVRKLLTKMWPKIVGSPVTIRIGAQDKIDGSVAWNEPKVFTPGTDRFVDTIANGAALSVEFSTTETGDWHISGYDMEIHRAGRY